MQTCIGIYIENNLIKYAKVSKNKNDIKIDAFGMNFFNNISDAIKKVIEETYSFNVPVCINLANEKYLYFSVFNLLSEQDQLKTIQTEFETYCEEKKYNLNAFETRSFTIDDVENKDKVRAVQIFVNKIDLNKQKQLFEKNKLFAIAPLGVTIAKIAGIAKKENALIVNMEEKTTITSVFDRQVYSIETIDNGFQEVLEKINRQENSFSKTYEILKNTTIYTSDALDDSSEQPHLSNIMPTLYEIAQNVKQIIETSPVKITNVYITGTLSAINNIDLYFQEFTTGAECKILKPNILGEYTNNINIKDYIEVNSAIALAVFGVNQNNSKINFKKQSMLDKIKQNINIDIGTKKPKKPNDKTSIKEKMNLDFSFSREKLDKTETILVRFIVFLLILIIIFAVFSNLLYKQMEKKQAEIQALISEEQSEISKINKDASSLNKKNDTYKSMTEELKSVNDKISNIAEMKNSIPNLLNQIMYIIPEAVQLESIDNTESEKKVTIVAKSNNYDQLGYFVAKIKLEGYLKDVVTSSGKSAGGPITITIEGELP